MVGDCISRVAVLTVLDWDCASQDALNAIKAIPAAFTESLGFAREGRTMYDELVKRLRDKAGGLDYDGWVDTAASLEEAADAIEKLSRKVEELEAMREISPEAEYAIDKHADNLIAHMDELIKGLKSEPRWIPVTEEQDG